MSSIFQKCADFLKMNVARVYQAEKSVQSHYPRGQKKESHGYTWVKGKKARGKTQVHKFIILTRRDRFLKGYEPNSVKPQSSSPPSQPGNVKTVGHEIDHEVKQQNTAVRHEDGNVSVDSSWTKIINDRPARLRRRDLAARKGENKSSSPLLGQKVLIPSSRPAELSKSSFINARIDKERKRQKDFSTLQAQVTTLTGTLESLMHLIKQGNLGSILTPKIEGTPVRKFNVESPSRVTPKVSFKEVLSRTPSPIKSSSSSARSSPSNDSATSSPKDSPVATPNPCSSNFVYSC